RARRRLGGGRAWLQQQRRQWQRAERLEQIASSGRLAHHGSFLLVAFVAWGESLTRAGPSSQYNWRTAGRAGLARRGGSHVPLWPVLSRRARACEILADRWTLLIVRELLAGVDHFNGLDRGLPGISRALLAERLRRLERTGVVVRRAGAGRVAYSLTPAGGQLQPIICGFGGWGGGRWAGGGPRPSELDPVVLLWWMKRRVHRDRLPARRVVIQFDFAGIESAATGWSSSAPTSRCACSIPSSRSTCACRRTSRLSIGCGSA